MNKWLRKMVDWHQICAELRQQWNDRWMPGRHDQVIMERQKTGHKYRKLAEECEKEKDCEK